MTVYRFVDLDCDGPQNRGCPYDNKIQADSVTLARLDAKANGWCQELLDDGIRIDLCILCKKEN